MSIQFGKSLEEVLDELLFERGTPTPDAIATWATLYPEHRAALVEFAASWAEDEHLPLPRVDEARQRSVVAKTMNQFRAAAAPAVPRTLSALAGSAGRTLDDVARGLGVDASVIAKLNARRIDPATIGRAMAVRISKLLKVDTAAVIASWSGAPAPLAAAAFLGRPAPLPQETLAQALAKVGAPNELIAELEAD